MAHRRTIVTLALAVVLGALAFLLLRTRDLDAQLATSREEQEKLGALVASSNQEKDTLRRQVRALRQRVAGLEQDAARPGTVAAEAPPRAVVDAGLAPPPADPPSATPSPRVTTVAPGGWSKNGSSPGAYVVGVDPTQPHAGLPSAYVKSTEPSVEGFGGMMQTTAAADFIGKRLRYSAWVKAQDATQGGGHLWLRIDGDDGSMLGFDNMDGRAVEGSSDWQLCAVVLDVPPGSAALAYGFFVAGAGQLWVSGAKLEVVGPDVPTTDSKAALPTAPRNLDFR